MHLTLANSVELMVTIMVAVGPQLASAEADVDAMVRATVERRAAQRSGLDAFLASLFARRTGLRPLLVIASLFALQQFAGVHVTLFFAVDFFKVRRGRGES